MFIKIIENINEVLEKKYIKRVYQEGISRGYIKRVYQEGISRGYIQRAYQEGISRGYIKRVYQEGISRGSRKEVYQRGISRGHIMTQSSLSYSFLDIYINMTAFPCDKGDQRALKEGDRGTR